MLYDGVSGKLFLLKRKKMNRCVAMGGGYDEERRMGSMICPKPRRLGLLNPSINDSIRPLRWAANFQQSDYGDSKAGTDLLDIILTKGGFGAEKSGNQVASSPPYFCGSPPTRASNPLIQDAQFGKEKLAPLTPAPPSPSSRIGGGCVRVKFGHKTPSVRIEGFDCLSRDRGNCSISAVA